MTSMTRLDLLTAEQEALLPLIRDEWLGYGLATAPANRAEAEAGIADAYRAAGLEAPAIRIWLDSPMAGALGAAMLASPPIGDQVGAQVWDQVWAQVGAQVYKAVYGQHDASWLGWLDAFGRHGLVDAVERATGLMRVARSAGWWWPFRGAVVLTERPSVLVRDDDHRLHSATGPAIQYPDGWGIWAWHGVPVPQQVIERPETLSATQVTAERNTEVRRVMIERMGTARYLREAGARKVHTDDWGTLWRLEQRGDEPIVMVSVLNSTPDPDGGYSTYWLRVDPQLRPMLEGGRFGDPQEMTARNAVASTFGQRGEEYELVCQT